MRVENVHCCSLAELCENVKTPGHQLIMRLIIQTVHRYGVHKCKNERETYE